MRKEFATPFAIATMALAPAAFAQSAASAPSPAADPAAAGAVATLQQVCLPILRGGAVKAAAQAGGFALKDGGWVKPLAGKDEIDLAPPDAANPHVCTLTIDAPAAEAAAMRNALGAWAAAQNPPLAPAGVDQQVPGAAQKWVTSTWSAQTRGGTESIVLTQPQSPTTAAPDQTTLLVSLAPT